MNPKVFRDDWRHASSAPRSHRQWATGSPMRHAGCSPSEIKAGGSCWIGHAHNLLVGQQGRRGSSWGCWVWRCSHWHSAPKPGAQTLPPELSELSLEDLMNVEVTTVSRRAERLSTTAASVFVLTNDDIRRSGAVSIPDALVLCQACTWAKLMPILGQSWFAGLAAASRTSCSCSWTVKVCIRRCSRGSTGGW